MEKSLITCYNKYRHIAKLFSFLKGNVVTVKPKAERLRNINIIEKVRDNFGPASEKKLYNT